jgi:serine/threonine protein kinase
MPTPEGEARTHGPGEVIAERYVLERLLGEGGMGTVWAARNQRTNRRVAMKFLRPGVKSAGTRERFLREARAAGTLDHPNVCQVLDVIELGEDLALVLELLEGETLARHLAARGTLSIADAAALLLPVVSAIGTAHAHGIIHRDLKPENIFVTRDRGMKVLDFGIAKVDADDGAQVTVTGSLLGTPAYMAPEQVFGEPIDHRADIWALGLVLYQCLSGVLPTEEGAGNIGQVLKTIVARPIRPLAELAPHLPADVLDLVTRMLARVRAKRPATLQEIFDVLRLHTDVEAPAFADPRRSTNPPAVEAHAPSYDALDGDPTEAPTAAPTEAPATQTLGPYLPPPWPWRTAAFAGAAAVALLTAGWLSLRPTARAAATPTAALEPATATVAARPAPEPPAPTASAQPEAPAASSARPVAPPPPRARIAPKASADPLGDAR